VKNIQKVSSYFVFGVHISSFYSHFVLLTATRLFCFLNNGLKVLTAPCLDGQNLCYRRESLDPLYREWDKPVLSSVTCKTSLLGKFRIFTFLQQKVLIVVGVEPLLNVVFVEVLTSITVKLSMSNKGFLNAC